MQRIDTDAVYQGSPDTSLVGRISCDVGGRVTLASDGIADRLDFAPAEIISRRLVDLVDPADQSALEASLESVASGRDPISALACRLMTRDGGRLTVLLVAADGAAGAGRSDGFECLVQEVRVGETSVIPAAVAGLDLDELRIVHTVATIANTAATLEDAAAPVIRALCARFGWQHGALIRWRGPDKQAEIVCSTADGRYEPRLPPPHTARPYRLGDDASGYTAVVAIDDAKDLALVFRQMPPDQIVPFRVLSLVAAHCSQLRHRPSSARRSADRFYQVVFEASSAAAVVAGTPPMIIAANEAMAKRTGHLERELIGMDAAALLPPDEATALTAAVADSKQQHTTAGHTRLDVPVTILNKDGEPVPAVISPIATDAHASPHTVIITVTEDPGADNIRETDRDSLTGLATRRLLLEILDGDMDASEYALILVDVDNFKTINDVYGHAVGDEVLANVATRLLAAVRPDDVVARLGGDEFVIVCRADGAVGAAAAIVERVRRLLTDPVQTAEASIRLTVSIGIDDGRTDAASGADSLRRADRAMYEAKRLGKNRYQFYDAQIERRIAADRRVEMLLSGAIAERRLVVMYQPIVSLATSRIVGVEASVRLPDDGGSLLSPSEFLPIAERTGAIVAVDQWVLDEACRAVGVINRHRSEPLNLAVNISERFATAPNLMDAVLTALQSAGLGPAQLTLELTEGTLSAADQVSRGRLADLRTRGVRVALDGFGTGRSSINDLRQFPISQVKIDPACIATMFADRGGDAVIEVTTYLADRFALSWTVQGIETDAQWRTVQQFEGGFAQGYLFGRPQPADQLLTMLRGRAERHVVASDGDGRGHVLSEEPVMSS